MSYERYMHDIFLTRSFVAGFRGRHHDKSHLTLQDLQDVQGQDPHDTGDMELPDQLDLIHAFMAGLCKESAHDLRGLAALLSKLPDPSLSHGQVDAMPVTEARERGLIPEASDSYPKL